MCVCMWYIHRVCVCACGTFIGCVCACGTFIGGVCACGTFIGVFVLFQPYMLVIDRGKLSLSENNM